MLLGADMQQPFRVKVETVSRGFWPHPFTVCVLSVHVSGLLAFNNRDSVKMCGSRTHDFIQYTIRPVQSAVSLG